MQYLPMKLSVEDRVKNLLPAWLYYPYKIGREARAVEPELSDIARTRSGWMHRDRCGRKPRLL